MPNETVDPLPASLHYHQRLSIVPVWKLLQGKQLSVSPKSFVDKQTGLSTFHLGPLEKLSCPYWRRVWILLWLHKPVWILLNFDMTCSQGPGCGTSSLSRAPTQRTLDLEAWLFLEVTSLYIVTFLNNYCIISVQKMLESWHTAKMVHMDNKSKPKPLFFILVLQKKIASLFSTESTIGMVWGVGIAKALWQ